MSLPDSTLQTLTVQSRDPETNVLPSGENATETTKSVCPIRGPTRRSPLCASHIRIVWSSELDAIHLVSGVKLTE